MRRIHRNQQSTTADSEGQSETAKWIERAIVGCLFLFALFAPHSIVATQLIWTLGALLWALRLAIFPRPPIYKTPLDYALLGFFILTGLSSFLSYEPLVSIAKLRAASLFTIVYLFAENVPSLRVLRLLAITLLASSMISVCYTVGEFAIGRGVKIQGLKIESPLYASGVKTGDTLLEIDGHKIHDPEDLVTALAQPDRHPALIKGYRHELLPTFKVERGRFLTGSTAIEKLGIDGWSKGRDWRATGFYGHYTTYAEVLQLVLALVVGLLVSLPSKRSWVGVWILIALAGLCSSLMLTVTRASWLGFLVSCAVILLIGTNRRTIVVVGALVLPLVLAGLFVLRQKRNVAFFDPADASTTWRETVWREGFSLLVNNPRHLLIGVGMDSIKSHWREWDMFDHGRLPIGHMHSNLLQIALERGVPALLVWLLLLGLYARMLWRLNRKMASVKPSQDEANLASGEARWVERGVVLGALGGLCGFLVSGVVHYNWGDSEVVMILYFFMGLSLVVQRMRG